jgi:hypothetical protein
MAGLWLLSVVHLGCEYPGNPGWRELNNQVSGNCHILMYNEYKQKKKAPLPPLEFFKCRNTELAGICTYGRVT